MRRPLLVLGTLASFAGIATAQPAPGVLPHGVVTTTITAEIDMTSGRAGDPTSIAPDLAVGVTDELTLSVLHSTFARTGFRGGAGAGICLTDACAHAYDNAGVEATYGLLAGPFAIAANAGMHATSFDRGHYAAKLGARMRVRAGQLSIVSVPSIAIAVTDRDAMVKNRDRIFLPIAASIPVARAFAVGVSSGFKAPLDDIGDSYEIALGAFAQYTLNPSVAFAASWVHGKLLGGSNALPDGQSGVDARAIQLWVTLTHAAFER